MQTTKSGTTEKATVESTAIGKQYADIIRAIERLHRLSLEVIKVELDRLGVLDVNNVQALILYNIGLDELTVGELTTRGCYLGSNVSYNLKKMVENGYLTQERSQHDRRSMRVRATSKGQQLRDHLAALFERHAKALPSATLAQEQVNRATDTLAAFERFWSQQARMAGVVPISDAA